MKLETIFLPLIFLFSFSPNIWREVSAYKGLFIMNFGAKSYKNFFGSVMRSLTEKGHKITFVGPFNFNLQNENITEITVAEGFYNEMFGNTFKKSVMREISFAFQYFPEACSDILEDPTVKDALNEEYDYVILTLFYTECFWDYIYQNKVPLIYISPNVMMSPYSTRTGVPEFSSTYPHKLLPLTYPLSFVERTLSVLGELMMISLVELVTGRLERRCLERGLCSTDTPPVSELGKHVSLTIINSIRPLEKPVKPIPPNIVYAGGIHIKQNKSLPKDIEKWLNESGDAGFILISMGTAVKPQDMKKEDLEVILEVFGSLRQRIIWSWNSKDIENLPLNIMIRPFLPQQDILAHPKIRMYITHGGMLSIQEATYYGVPIVGMPVFGDQKGNIKEIVNEGWGRNVHWKDFTKEKFISAIHDVLTNKSISMKAKERSILMRDWPSTPAEEVHYWTEYVIRHKGAKHLQSPFVNMSWYEIYNIDVWFFILVSCTTIVVINYLLLKLSFTFVKRKIFKKNKID